MRGKGSCNYRPGQRHTNTAAEQEAHVRVVNQRACVCVSEEEDEDQTPKKKALEMAKFRITRGL